MGKDRKGKDRREKGKGNKQITYLGIGLDEIPFPLPTYLTYLTYDLGD